MTNQSLLCQLYTAIILVTLYTVDDVIGHVCIYIVLPVKKCPEKYLCCFPLHLDIMNVSVNCRITLGQVLFPFLCLYFYALSRLRGSEVRSMEFSLALEYEAMPHLMHLFVAATT